MAPGAVGYFALSAVFLARAALALKASASPTRHRDEDVSLAKEGAAGNRSAADQQLEAHLQKALEVRVSSGLAALEREQAAREAASAKHVEHLEQYLKQAEMDAADAWQVAATAAELEAQRDGKDSGDFARRTVTKRIQDLREEVVEHKREAELDAQRSSQREREALEQMQGVEERLERVRAQRGVDLANALAHTNELEDQLALQLAATKASNLREQSLYEETQDLSARLASLRKQRSTELAEAAENSAELGRELAFELSKLRAEKEERVAAKKQIQDLEEQQAKKARETEQAMEDARQREALAWNHSADLVQEITKLNNLLRLEREDHGTSQLSSSEVAEELRREREAAEDTARRNAQTVENALRHNEELQTAVEQYQEALNENTHKLAIASLEASDLSADVARLQEEAEKGSEREKAFMARNEKLAEKLNRSQQLREAEFNLSSLREKSLLARNNKLVADLNASRQLVEEELGSAAEENAELRRQVTKQAEVLENATVRLAESAEEASNLTRQLDAMAKNVTELQAELARQTEERTALRAARDKLLEEKLKSGASGPVCGLLAPLLVAATSLVA